jgi:hypothetical protein
MFVKERILSISFYDSTILRIWKVKKSIVKNMASCFPTIEKDI